MNLTVLKKLIRSKRFLADLSGKNQGMSLVEMVIALSILAVAGMALVNIGLTTVAVSTSAKLKTRATALATERVEQLRACRDEKNQLPTLVGCGLSSPETIEVFTRKTSFLPSFFGGPDVVDIEVTVLWHERGLSKEVTLKTKLSQWKIREAIE